MLKILTGIILFLVSLTSVVQSTEVESQLLLESVVIKNYKNFNLEDEIQQEYENVQDGYVDYVLVKKDERKLYLYAEDKIVKSYKIALGKQPKGQKRKEGDSKTPEGLYTLDWRNPNSRFFRSIHVSYPNVIQSRSAREAGVDPGGAIMIHGQPTDWSERIKLTFSQQDWTEGCIALENQDMMEVWDLVRDGTPIKIDP